MQTENWLLTYTWNIHAGQYKVNAEYVSACVCVCWMCVRVRDSLALSLYLSWYYIPKRTKLIKIDLVNRIEWYGCEWKLAYIWAYRIRWNECEHSPTEHIQLNIILKKGFFNFIASYPFIPATYTIWLSLFCALFWCGGEGKRGGDGDGKNPSTFPYHPTHSLAQQICSNTANKSYIGNVVHFIYLTVHVSPNQK